MALICPSPSCLGLFLESERLYILHLLTFHSKEKLTLKCPESGCDKGGLQVKGLESHWRRHHQPGPGPHFHHTKRLRLEEHQATSSSSRETCSGEDFVQEAASSPPSPASSSEEEIVFDSGPSVSDEVPVCESPVEFRSLDLEWDSAGWQKDLSDDLPHSVNVLQEDFESKRLRAGGEFISSMKANCETNNASIQKILKETEKLLNFVFESVIDNLKEKKIDLGGVDLTELKTKVCGVFQGLHSPYLQMKYIQDQLKPVQPRAVPLNLDLKKTGSESVKLKVQTQEFYYVPVLEVLERLLAHPQFEDMTKSFADPDPDVLDCYSKGSNAKENSVLSAHPNALRLLLYYDEVETATGLSVHASNNQKLGAFYLTLENIKPQYRASLKTITLVGLVNFNFLKDNYERYLKIIMDRITVDLRVLESGCKLNSKLVFGTLIGVIGDHAGTHLICGFKCGFTARRFCRWCMLELSETHSAVEEDLLKRRTQQQYDEQIREIEAAKTLTQRDKKSTLYGLNRKCELNELESFHVIRGAPPDIMHTVLEGVMPRALKRVIVHCLRNLKVVTLPWLNAALLDFDYGFSEKSERPSPIKEDHLDKDGKLHQSAAQVWTLSAILPLILGPFVEEDDEHWINYATLLEISRILFSADVRKSSLPYLSSLVSSFLAGHLELYGHLPAKEHFLLHAASHIEQFGSLLTYSCMRMEANHKWFKRCIYVLGNYVNAPKLLSLRYQLNQAVNFSRPLLSPPKYGRVFQCKVPELSYGSLLSGTEVVVRTTSLKIDGLAFEEGKCYICVGFGDSVPLFAAVHHVVVWPQIVLVCLQVWTSHYDPHLSAYKIEDQGEYAFYQPGEVRGRRVFHAHSCQGSKYIVLKECIATSF